MNESEPQYRRLDIHDRVFRFAVSIIQFTRTFPRTPDAMQLGKQLFDAGTSVGANMEEADGAESRRGFIHKVSISRKEARESRYWLRHCAATSIGDVGECQALPKESDELVHS